MTILAVKKCLIFHETKKLSGAMIWLYIPTELSFCIPQLVVGHAKSIDDRKAVRPSESLFPFNQVWSFDRREKVCLNFDRKPHPASYIKWVLEGGSIARLPTKIFLPPSRQKSLDKGKRYICIYIDSTGLKRKDSQPDMPLASSSTCLTQHFKYS